MNGVRGEMCVWRKMVDVMEECKWEVEGYDCMIGVFFWYRTLG